MLKVYDHLEDLKLSKLLHDAINNRCTYYASDLMDALEYDDLRIFEEIIQTAERACMALDIPVKNNFKIVYRCDDNVLYKDWQLSRLACYLVSINGDPSNPIIAKAQLYFACNLKKDITVI
jgi:DNA-damage-inducible protein D